MEEEGEGLASCLSELDSAPVVLSLSISEVTQRYRLTREKSSFPGIWRTGAGVSRAPATV